jgi:glycerol uptake facilitator-like aquaporin
MMPSLAQRGVAECLGTAFLLAAVVGSGIMAVSLAGGNGALALLCNTLPTGAILVVLILVFGPLSGAHFNPAVSIAFALRRELSWPDAATYIVAQIMGGVVGVWIAHLMFGLPVWQVSLNARTGVGQVATFGLLLTILGCVSRTPAAVPYAVGLYITSAYWFTASTSFANPAVTVARSHRYLRGHRPHWRRDLHRRAVSRNARGGNSWTVALASMNCRRSFAEMTLMPRLALRLRDHC